MNGRARGAVPPAALVAALMAVIALGGCAGFGGVTPGVVLSASEVAIGRKADDALATYESDLSEAEPTLSVLSSDFEVDDSGFLAFGFNFTYQAPTRFRARQVQPEGSLPTRVQGRYTYATANFYEDFGNEGLSGFIQRITQGLGVGQIQIEGDVDFSPGPPVTSIPSRRETAYVYYLAGETRRFLGVENLFFRMAMGVHFAEDDQLEYTVSGFGFTFGYLFGAPGTTEGAEPADGTPPATALRP